MILPRASRRCVSVFDPTRQANKRKKFHFYQCRTYARANWYSGMGAINNQTGGAVATFYDRNGGSSHGR